MKNSEIAAVSILLFSGAGLIYLVFTTLPIEYVGTPLEYRYLAILAAGLIGTVLGGVGWIRARPDPPLGVFTTLPIERKRIDQLTRDLELLEQRTESDRLDLSGRLSPLEQAVTRDLESLQKQIARSDKRIAQLEHNLALKRLNA